jgi:hypothetical protein
MGWTMEQTYDSTGARKEIIVIEDSNTPDHIPRKRTRAMAAAEAAAEEADKQTSSKVNGSVASSVAAGGSGKKRKIAESSETAASKKAKAKAAVSLNRYFNGSELIIRRRNHLMPRRSSRPRHPLRSKHLPEPIHHGTMPRATISSSPTM